MDYDAGTIMIAIFITFMIGFCLAAVTRPLK
jgi:hypothetical protein